METDWGLFSSINQLPDPNHYPHNETEGKIKKVWLKYYRESTAILIATGFISLEYLSLFFENNPASENRRVRIVFGYEADKKLRKPANLNSSNLTKEVKEEWLRQGISILNAGAILHFIGLLRSKVVDVKFYDRLHAKIFVTNDVALLGSSNFTRSGLELNHEANVTISQMNEDRQRHPNYSEVKKLAELFWDTGRDFNEELIKVLSELLSFVSWQESLARAIHELLNGDWLKAISGLEGRLKVASLWPVQVQGIGRALSILDNQDSLLIADPTGSGKTKMTATIHCIFCFQKMFRNFQESIYSVVLTPPVVRANWVSQYDEFKFNDYKIVSHGALSQKTKSNSNLALKYVEQSDLLVIDEAHNFLNPTSQRSLSLLRTRCDNVILGTATPMNRRPEDLLRLVEILDPDNLNDQERVEYFNLRKNAKRLKTDEIERLKFFIGKFTLRRTKSEINSEIEKSPELYKNQLGYNCRYPEVVNKTYQLNESENDRNIAEEIFQISKGLRGILNLGSLKAKTFYLKDDSKSQKYLTLRLALAPALARYNIRSFLRSSRLAAIEHLAGSQEAAKFGGLKVAKRANSGSGGNMLARLAEMSNSLPKTNLRIKLEPFLEDLASWKKACEDEIIIYQKILSLIMQISDGREHCKALTVIEASKTHPLCLAFDSSIITLQYLAKLINELSVDIEVQVITGGNKAAQLTALRTFGLGSEKDKVIGLCSDAMAEGVNLQQASAVVFFDIPSVIRSAEQRIGRVNRLDSPHGQVEVHWPIDAPEFAMKKDERLASTIDLNGRLLGNNIVLPEELRKQTDETILVEDVIKDVENEERLVEKFWSEVAGAFQAVESLVGVSGILSDVEFEELRGIDSSVKSRIGIVESEESFAFVAIRGGERRPPKWVLYRPQINSLIIDLGEICNFLRNSLPKSVQGKWDNRASNLLQELKSAIASNEVLLLSNKKRRSLMILEKLLENMLKTKYFLFDSDEHKKSVEILKWLKTGARPDTNETLDLNRFAAKWLYLIQPVREKILNEGARKIVTLDEVRKYLRKNPQDFPSIGQLFDSIEMIDKPERRVAACIIGLGSI